MSSSRETGEREREREGEREREREGKISGFSPILIYACLHINVQCVLLTFIVVHIQMIFV